MSAALDKEFIQHISHLMMYVEENEEKKSFLLNTPDPVDRNDHIYLSVIALQAYLYPDCEVDKEVAKALWGTELEKDIVIQDPGAEGFSEVCLAGVVDEEAHEEFNRQIDNAEEVRIWI